MNMDQLLRDTFAAHEDLSPDEDVVLAGVHDRLASRRSVARPVAAAAAVAVVAVGAVALAHRSGAGSKDHHQAAASGPVTSQTSHTTKPAIERPALTMPFDLGWLPDGTRTYVRRINTGQAEGSKRLSFDGEYMASTTTLEIDVQQMPGKLGTPSFKSGPGRSVTVAGRPGVESVNSGSAGGYEVYFTDATGGVMYVNIGPRSGAKSSADEYRTVGRRIADDVRFPGTTVVRPEFGVGYLPAGMQIRAFDVEDLAGTGLPNGGTVNKHTSYEIGDRTSSDPAFTISNSDLQAGGRSGRTVQGHATRYNVDGKYRTVSVLDAIDGQPIVIGTFRTAAEAYRIADGLVLPS